MKIQPCAEDSVGPWKTLKNTQHPGTEVNHTLYYLTHTLCPTIILRTHKYTAMQLSYKQTLRTTTIIHRNRHILCTTPRPCTQLHTYSVLVPYHTQTHIYSKLLSHHTHKHMHTHLTHPARHVLTHTVYKLTGKETEIESHSSTH